MVVKTNKITSKNQHVTKFATIKKINEEPERNITWKQKTISTVSLPKQSHDKMV